MDRTTWGETLPWDDNIITLGSDTILSAGDGNHVTFLIRWTTGGAKTVTIDNLNDGDYTVYLVDWKTGNIADQKGVVATAGTATFSVDVTWADHMLVGYISKESLPPPPPPSKPTLLSPADGATIESGSVEFRWDDVGVSTYHLKVDEDVHTTSLTSMTLELGDGPHSWTVQAVNESGRASGYADVRTLTVKLPLPPLPKPTLLSPADGTIAESASVVFQWSDVAVPTYHLQVGEDVYTTSGTSMTLELSDGTYSWTAQAVDESGRTSGYADLWTVTVKVPLPPPTKPALLSPADETVVESASVEFRWSDVGVSTYHLKVDGDVHTTDLTSMTLELSDGSHSWTVQAVNDSGSASGYADVRTVTVKLSLPPPTKPTLLSPADGAVVESASVEFRWSDVGAASYQLRVDEQVYTTGGVSLVVELGEGTHAWSVQAVDASDQVSGYTDTWTVVVELPPLSALVRITIRDETTGGEDTLDLKPPHDYTIDVTTEQ
jgi:hypothetical protein